MIFSDSAVVLLRKNHRESDRVVSVYTKTHGRLVLRYPGVNRPKGKLKALSEPLSWIDLRIYMRNNSAIGCAAGGKIINIFPSLRSDLNKLKLGFYFCELMFRITPEHQPSEAKYNLLVSSLVHLEFFPTPAIMAAAFTLRLMQLAGFGLDKPVLGIKQEIWKKLHTSSFNELFFESENSEDLQKAAYVSRRFIRTHFDIPLKTASVLDFLPAPEPILS